MEHHQKKNTRKRSGRWVAFLCGKYENHLILGSRAATLISTPTRGLLHSADTLLGLWLTSGANESSSSPFAVGVSGMRNGYTAARGRIMIFFICRSLDYIMNLQNKWSHAHPATPSAIDSSHAEQFNLEAPRGFKEA